MIYDLQCSKSRSTICVIWPRRPDVLIVSPLCFDLELKSGLKKGVAKKPLNYSNPVPYILVLTFLVWCNKAFFQERENPLQFFVSSIAPIYFVSILILSIPLVKALWRRRTRVDKPFFSPSHLRRLTFSLRTSHPVTVLSRKHVSAHH